MPCMSNSRTVFFNICKKIIKISYDYMLPIFARYETAKIQLKFRKLLDIVSK